MKKSVYISGIVCIITMLLGCMFKVMHWPGASVLLIFSVFLFCFFFLPMGLKNNYESMPIKNYKTLHIIAFIVFFICIMGVLFKVMHWPGASVFLLLGVLLPFVLFFPAYLYSTRDEEKAGNKNFLGIVLGLTFLAVFGVFLALTVSKQVVSSAVTSVNIYENDANYYYSNKERKNLISESADDLYNYMNDLKCQLLNTAGEEMCSGNTPNANYKPEKIAGLDNRDAVRFVFLSEEGPKGSIHLKEKIDTFRNVVLNDKNISPELAELASQLFYTGDEDIYGVFPKGTAWEQREFNNYSVAFMLDFLAKIQSNVRLVEGELIN